MNEPTTTPTLEPPPIKAILEWQAKKKVLRDYLCLAATLRCWDPRQDEGSIDEDFVTEADFDKAIEEAKGLVLKYRQTNQQLGITRPKQVAVFAHPEQLIAIIVRKPTAQELAALMKLRRDGDLTPEQVQEHFTGDLVQRTLWPTNGSLEMARLIDEEPAALKYAFTNMLLETVGASGLAQARRG